MRPLFYTDTREFGLCVPYSVPEALNGDIVTVRHAVLIVF